LKKVKTKKRQLLQITLTSRDTGLGDVDAGKEFYPKGRAVKQIRMDSILVLKAKPQRRFVAKPMVNITKRRCRWEGGDGSRLFLR